MKTRSAFKFRRRLFTLIELMMVVAITMVLMGMLLPNYRDVRQRAKFVRWHGYNAHWNRDADCVVNYNFQDGKRNPFQKLSGADIKAVKTIYNGAEGCDWTNGFNSYNARDYDGVVSNVSGSGSGLSFTSATAELQQAGRWGKYKQAMYFNGVNTALQVSRPCYGFKPIVNDATINSSGNVVVSNYSGTTVSTGGDFSKVDKQRDALDFTALDSFTIVTWIKFLEAPTSMQCIFSRACGGLSGVKNPNQNGFANSQYDMVTDIQASGKGSFNVELSTLVCCPPDDTVDFKNKNWKQVILVYKYPPPAATGAGNDAYRSIGVYIDGKKVNDLSEANYSSGSIVVSGNPGGRAKNVASIGGLPWYGYPTSNKYNYTCLFKGYMDEFAIFKRAFTDAEAKGCYLMGSE